MSNITYFPSPASRQTKNDLLTPQHHITMHRPHVPTHARPSLPINPNPITPPNLAVTELQMILLLVHDSPPPNLRDWFSLLRHSCQCRRRREMFSKNFPVHVLLLGGGGRHREPIGGEFHLQITDPFLGNYFETVNPGKWNLKYSEHLNTWHQ